MIEKFNFATNTQHEVELNSVATKTAIVATKVEKNYNKNVAT